MIEFMTTQTTEDEAFQGAMVLFLIEGNEREEADLLLQCSVACAEEYDRDDDLLVRVEISGPRRAYDLLQAEGTGYERIMRAAIAASPPHAYSVKVAARARKPSLNSEKWREELRDALAGAPVDNQAVGVEAPKVWQGLRFRSESERRVARALDGTGVFFLPNCRGRIGHPEARANREADFLVVLNGRVGILEVDGEPFHPPTRTVHDHERDRAFRRAGIALVEHYDATRCYREPDRVVAEFLEALKH